MLDRTNKVITVSCRSFNQINTKLLSLVSKNENMEMFKKNTAIRMNREIPTKQAAILVPICIKDDNKVSLLYTMRSPKLRTFSKQVSFPGKSLISNSVILISIKI